MKIISTFTLAAIMTLGTLAARTNHTVTMRDTDRKDHGRLILPRPVVAVNGTDGGCIRLPGDDKRHPVRTESHSFEV